MENDLRTKRIKLIAGILIAVYSVWGLIKSLNIAGGMPEILIAFICILYFGSMMFLAVTCFLPGENRLLMAIALCAVAFGAFIDAVAMYGGIYDIYLMMVAAFFAVTLFLNGKLPVKKLSLVYALAPSLLFLLRVIANFDGVFSGYIYSPYAIFHSLLPLALSVVGAAIVSYDEYDKAALNKVGRLGLIILAAGIGYTLLFVIGGLIFGKSLAIKGVGWTLLWFVGELAVLGGVGLAPLCLMYPGKK